LRRSDCRAAGLWRHILPGRSHSLRELCERNRNLKSNHMLNYAIIFLIIAILAGVLGFGVIAGTAAMVAKVCFVVFLVLFLFSLFGGSSSKRL
jgi:uncharacterized membrane protein YtjA (UPF0391 family)